MEKNILKIDCDCESLEETIDLIVERCSYLHDTGFLPFKHFNKIIAGKKTKFNVKIYLNCDLREEFIIMLQLIFNSDWRKEINTIVNHYVLKMDYSNRMFDIKRYKSGNLKYSKKYNITSIVEEKVRNPLREKSYV